MEAELWNKLLEADPERLDRPVPGLSQVQTDYQPLRKVRVAEADPKQTESLVPGWERQILGICRCQCQRLSSKMLFFWDQPFQNSGRNLRQAGPWHPERLADQGRQVSESERLMTGWERLVQRT